MFWRKKQPKEKALVIDETNFKSVVMESENPVLLDFWASWCTPCKVMGPIIDELAREYKGKIVVGKVNTEQAQRLAASFGIRSIPTLVIMEKGKVVEKYTGIVPKPNLQEILNGYSQDTKVD